LRLKEPLLTPTANEVGENLPLLYMASSPSREFLFAPAFGTCSVCRCFSVEGPAGGGAFGDDESGGLWGAAYVGGEESRCGDDGAVRRGLSLDGGDACCGFAVDKDDVLCAGAILWDTVDNLREFESVLVGSPLPFAVGIGGGGLVGHGREFPFVDVMELLSPFQCLTIPGLLLPFSDMPLEFPISSIVPPFREDRFSQLLALERPFVKALRFPSCSTSPLTREALTLPPSTYASRLSVKLPFSDVCEEDLAFPLVFS
jgi:hypothetical protein